MVCNRRLYNACLYCVFRMAEFCGRVAILVENVGNQDGTNFSYFVQRFTIKGMSHSVIIQ